MDGLRKEICTAGRIIPNAPSDLAGRDEEVIAVKGDAAVEADNEEDWDEDVP